MSVAGSRRSTSLGRSPKLVADGSILFHLAGAVDFNNDWEHCRRVNVEGTANVLAAAGRSGVRRVIHASSIVAVGASRTPMRLNESAPWNLGSLAVPYVTTKHEAERIANPLLGERRGVSPTWTGTGQALAVSQPTSGLRLDARHSTDIVIVNPASVIGPDDFTGSEFGLLCRRFWQGRIPFVFGGGSNFVDVRDVASGMLAAAERGRAGERYILGGVNRSYTAFFSDLASVNDRPILRMRLPTGFARAGAALGDQLQRKRRKRPLLTSAQARLLGLFFYYDCSKAERELGFSTRPLPETLADTHEFWMVKRDSLRRLAHAA